VLGSVELSTPPSATNPATNAMDRVLTNFAETGATSDTEYIRIDLYRTLELYRVIVYPPLDGASGLDECDLRILDATQQVYKAIPFPTPSSSVTSVVETNPAACSNAFCTRGTGRQDGSVYVFEL
jgi:hypothetical protein